MPYRFETTLRLLVIQVLLLLGAASAHAQPSLFVYDFNLDLGPTGNVDHVQALGFDGLVTRLATPTDVVELKEYVTHVATLDDFRMLGYVPYDFTDPASPFVWRDALPFLARARAPLWVLVRKAPSELAVLQLLEQMANESQAYGVKTVIYPHWNTNIETAAEASALIEELGHPNLSNSLHTCHEIRSGNQYSLGEVVAQHAAETSLVAIAGAEENAYSGPPAQFITWDDAIKPLDEGDFGLLPFLQALHDSGYDGPVVLQTFGIVDNPGHLERSLRKYEEYLEQLVVHDAPGHGTVVLPR